MLHAQVSDSIRVSASGIKPAYERRWSKHNEQRYPKDLDKDLNNMKKLNNNVKTNLNTKITLNGTNSNINLNTSKLLHDKMDPTDIT